MYKIGRTETGVEIFCPQNNVIYNLNETTWEIIKAVKKYNDTRAVKEISNIFLSVRKKLRKILKRSSKT